MTQNPPSARLAGLSLAAAMICAALTATPVLAETQFNPGGFVRQTHHWDSDARRMVEGAAEGEGEGCWQVLAVTAEGVEMKLISGHVKPWWSDEPIEIGSTDTWFDSELYREANPDHPPLTEIGATFTSVEECG